MYPLYSLPLTAHLKSEQNGDGLRDNQAYGNIQLTGANAVGNGGFDAGLHTRNNTYMTNQDPNDFTVSGLGPAYETIDDAKKAARAAASTASNPIYASAVAGSQSQTQLVDNPVYAEANKKTVIENGAGKGHTDLSALNPVYSGIGSPPHSAGPPPPSYQPQSPAHSISPIPHSGPRPPPYQTQSPAHPISPVPLPSQGGSTFQYTDVSQHTSSAVPLPQQGGGLNRSHSSEQPVPPHLNPVYEEINQKQGVRLRSTVSVSSDHEQTLPLARNESYGLIASSSTTPLITSPPPSTLPQPVESPPPTSPRSVNSLPPTSPLPVDGTQV